MTWLVIGAIAYLVYLYGVANPKVAAGIIVITLFATIGFFLAPALTWGLLLTGLTGLLAWLAVAYWYVIAAAVLGLLFFLGALLSIGAVLS